MANQLHDLQDRMDQVFVASRPAGASAASPLGVGPSRDAWPPEPSDLFVLEPTRPLALCTLGDPDLARRLAASNHALLAVAGPLATENLGIERLVRNVLAAPGIRAIVLVGPETGGSAPTGHYAGDALACLLYQGVDAETRRIRGTKGRRPILKNVTLDEVERFRARVRLVDHRGLLDEAAILEVLDEAGSGFAPGEPAESGDVIRTGGAPSSGGHELWVESPPDRRLRPDPAGYFVIFCDHGGRCLVLEHYTNQDVRTLVLKGEDPLQLAAAAVERALVSTLDHAVYLGGELERAARALEVGGRYVQDERR